MTFGYDGLYANFVIFLNDVATETARRQGLLYDAHPLVIPETCMQFQKGGAGRGLDPGIGQEQVCIPGVKAL